MSHNSKLKTTYWIIVIKHHLDYGRKFSIEMVSCNDPFHYVRKLHGMCFETGKDAEKEILRKLKVTHGLYKRINGRYVKGIEAPVYLGGEIK